MYTFLAISAILSTLTVFCVYDVVSTMVRRRFIKRETRMIRPKIFKKIFHYNNKVFFLPSLKKIQKHIFEDPLSALRPQIEEVFIRQINRYITQSLLVINYRKNLANKFEEEIRALQNENRQLKKSVKQLKKLNATKDELLSIASHELRTPLSVIKGYANLLKLERYGTLQSDQKKFVKKIEIHTNELVSLINKILDISEIESNNMKLELQEFDLLKFLAPWQEKFEIIFQEKGLKLVFENWQKLRPRVILDSEKLGIVISNLLGNAYKFSPKDSVITLQLRSESSTKIILEIEDQGPGISQDSQEVIFNKFQQAEDGLQKNYTGSGLGLNIAKQLTEKMGGKIWVKSEHPVKKGTIFCISLPARVLT